MSDDIITRLREAIAEHPLSPIHGYAEDIAALLDRLDAAERENERLRAERDEHARWRVDLADKLHDAESQISAAWAALRRAGIQSEETVAEAIALLHAENERLRSESKAQLEELDRIDDALGTNEGPSAVDHIVILKTENERLRESIGMAYGYLWCVNNEPGTPFQYPPEKAAYEARAVLRDTMTSEQRGTFINRAVALVRGGKTTPPPSTAIDAALAAERGKE